MTAQEELSLCEAALRSVLLSQRSRTGNDFENQRVQFLHLTKRIDELRSQIAMESGENMSVVAYSPARDVGSY